MGEFEADSVNMKLHNEYEKLIECGDYLYGIVPDILPATFHKYTKTQPQTIVNSYTISTDLISERSTNHLIFAYNHKIYILSSKSWIEFNPTTDEFRKMPDIGIYPSQWNGNYNSFALHENELYCFSSGNCKVFNFLTEKTSAFPNSGYKAMEKTFFTLCPVVGKRIYLTVSDQAIYTGVVYYDIETKTYGEDSLSKAMKQCYGGHGGLNNAILYGNYLYVLYAKYDVTNGLKRINIKDYTIEQLAELPFSPGGNFWLYGDDPTLILIDDKFYINSGKWSNYQLYSISNDTSFFEDKTLVLTQGTLYNNAWVTGLYTVPATEKGRIVWPCYDVNYYKNGKFSDAPMYYGTGTEWKKFKN